MTDIGFAVIGTGNIAEKHAAAIKDAQGAKLITAHSRTKSKLDEFAAKWNIKGETDLDALLRRDDIGALTIATPSGAHLPIVEPAAKAGKHILCEKPLEVTVERADKLIKACEDNNVILAGVFQARLNKNVQLIKKALDEGKFGKLLLASMQVKWFRDQDYYDSGAWRGTWELDGGGALMNQSIHAVDLLMFLAGKPISVTAAGGAYTHERIDVEDTVAAMVQFENGAVGTIEASTSCAPGFPRRLEISGSKGSIVLEDDAFARWEFTEPTQEDTKIKESIGKGDNMGSGASDPNAISHEGHKRLVEDLVNAINTGSKPAIPGAEARKAIELIRGVYASMESGNKHEFN